MATITPKAPPAAPTRFGSWEVVKDVVDELIDLSVNYRQSGHPGGSRSKVHLLLALLLSGAMRWDLLRPWRRFTDRLMNSEPFWRLRKVFMAKYGVEYSGVDGPAPKDPNDVRAQARRNLERTCPLSTSWRASSASCGIARRGWAA